MRVRSRRMAISTALAVSVALSVALSLALPALLSAQRRPGVAMGFYTTTGLVTGEVEGGSVTSSTALASSPSFEASFLLTAPLKKLPKRAWIVGVRARALALTLAIAVIVMDTKRVSPHRFECHTPTKITSPRRMDAPSRAGRAATGTQSPRCARRSDHKHERLGAPLRA